MKYLLMLVVFSTLLFVESAHYYQETPSTNNGKLKHMTRIPESQINMLAHTCYKDWKKLNWKIGGSQMAADKNPAFREGIKRVCLARSELFFEGYDLSPFIKADTESKVYPIVFLPTVEEIKSHMKTMLPKLRVI